MHKKTILLFYILFTSLLGNAQSLTNDQLVKVYGSMADALDRPRTQLAEATRITINQILTSIDSHWKPISKGDKLYNDDEMWFTWNYYLNDNVTSFMTPTYKAVGNDIIPTLQYFTPYSAPFKESLKQISHLGKLISQSTNSYNGTEMVYNLEGLTFLYSTFPPHDRGFTLDGKPVKLYKITITKIL